MHARTAPKADLHYRGKPNTEKKSTQSPEGSEDRPQVTIHAPLT
jgi:hypothetical protein